MAVQLKGILETLSWKEVRGDFSKINPELAKIIDRLSPNDDHFFAKATYPYGSYILRKAKLMVPNEKGNIVSINDSSIASKFREEFSYNIESNPVSLLLKNTCEIFYDLDDRIIPVSGLIPPGSLFGSWRVLNAGVSQQPIFLWDMTAGARSVFMLPKITEEKKHFKLKKSFNVKSEIPDSFMDHWKIFREIANHANFKQAWNTEILFFSKKWFDHLDDKKWMEFYYYLYRLAWRGAEFWRNEPIWDIIFSIIIKEYRAKPRAYIADTAKYLLHMGIGSRPGFSPALDNFAGPMAGLQEVYQSEYSLRSYPPIIMHSNNFNMHDRKSPPVYYSLQFPVANELSPNSRARISLVSDLHDIRSLLIQYKRELLSNKFNVEGTPIVDFLKLGQYDYFHNNVELHEGMRNSDEMAVEDVNLRRTVDGKIHKAFPDMSLFVKGCIRVAHKKPAG